MDVFQQIKDTEDAERKRLRDESILRNPSGLKLANPVCLLCGHRYWVTDDYPNLEYCPVCDDKVKDLWQVDE